MPVRGTTRVWRWQLSLAIGVLLLPLWSPLARAAGDDDRSALQSFVATGAISNRRLLEDLGRAQWPPQELRAAVARSYGIRTVALSLFLGSSAGAALLSRQLPWWSSDLAPQVRLAALRAAILADSRDGAISLLGVLEQLPVRFELVKGPLNDPQPSPEGSPVCGCPEGCGASALARLAFLMACLQAGAEAASAR